MALVVLNVVELKELLADVVVAAFDLALRRFDHAREHLRFDRDAGLEVELVGDGTVAGEEAAQQGVFTSFRSGTLCRTVSLPASTDAAMIGSTAFLAPCTWVLPVSLFPP